jgi:hypothetical protein
VPARVAVTAASLVTALAVAGEPTGMTKGLIARWHSYSEVLMWGTELVRIERLAGGRYRVDVGGQALHSMDSPRGNQPVYLDRDTPVDSLESGDKIAVRLIVDPTRGRIVFFEPVGAIGSHPAFLASQTYKYDRRSWKRPAPSAPRRSVVDSLGVDSVGGYPARHYRISWEDDPSVGLFRGMAEDAPRQAVEDVWFAGPEARLDAYFKALNEVPIPQPDPNPKTGGIDYDFQERGGEDADAAAVRRSFREHGHPVRTEFRVVFHGPGVAAAIPPEADPLRPPPGDTSADTVRSILLSRDSLASLRATTLAPREFDLPAGSRSMEEWQKSVEAGSR